jgi:hypothetical protein
MQESPRNSVAVGLIPSVSEWSTMGIIGWACPGCKRKMDLDHFNTTPCGAVVHPDYANAVLQMDADHYISGVVEITHGLSCPRARAIESEVSVYVNPLDYNALLIGRAWDGYLEAHGVPELCKLQVHGQLAGVEVYGEIDRLRRIKSQDGNIYLVVEDHKHGNNFAQKYAKQEGPKPEHIIQASLYAELLAQMGQERPTHGAIWNHYSGANAEPLTPFLFLLWDTITCLNYKPFGGQYTVADLYQQTARRFSGEVHWDDLPLVGNTMSFGTKLMCDYCAVRETCFTEDTGAPF